MIKSFAASARRNAGVIVRDGAGIVGAAMIAVGAGEIYRPAGWIVGGAMLVAAAFMAGRSAS